MSALDAIYRAGQPADLIAARDRLIMQAFVLAHRGELDESDAVFELRAASHHYERAALGFRVGRWARFWRFVRKIGA